LEEGEAVGGDYDSDALVSVKVRFVKAQKLEGVEPAERR
jgi:hypothetical protein